jgi:PAS domain S-box-containing protein
MTYFNWRAMDRTTRWGLPIALGAIVVGAVVVDSALGGTHQVNPMLVGVSLLALVTLAVVQNFIEHRLWFARIHGAVDQIDRLADDPGRTITFPEDPELVELAQAVESLRLELVRLRELASGSAEHPCTAAPQGLLEPVWKTRSGLFNPSSGRAVPIDPMASGEFTSQDMICRLEPNTLRWLDASEAAESFFGWPLRDLRAKSFLDVTEPEHRDLAREQLKASLIKGEAHGLIYRVTTARDEHKAVEMNVSVRYGSDMSVTHLRAHLTDVTAKLLAGRELRKRTRELTQANEQLRRINRELEDLKNRYGDLYQNAPAMYFSLDESGVFLECNNTLLRTLGYRRRELIGKSYEILLPDDQRASFPERFATFLREGVVEVESRWALAGGGLIDVWVTGTAVLDSEGRLMHSRSVAQDITARKALRAELQEKNSRLALANEELSRKNRELDDFTHVVSHDLQEPIRTLIAFSDFLSRDCGDRLDDSGREYVRYIVEASRRMRLLIRDLLDLSRAGRVTGEPREVDMNQLLGFTTSDLAELIRTRQAEVRVEGPLPAVWGDRERIGQLFQNLVTNGLKYNKQPRPVVVVGVAPPRDGIEAADQTTFFVRDNGIGIDPKFHSKIFQIFRRLHTREEYEGTGAGLAICQKIAQAHGGSIWVESMVDSGSTFYISLPRPPAEASSTPRTTPAHAQ